MKLIKDKKFLFMLFGAVLASCDNTDTTAPTPTGSNAKPSTSGAQNTAKPSGPVVQPVQKTEPESVPTPDLGNDLVDKAKAAAKVIEDNAGVTTVEGKAKVEEAKKEIMETYKTLTDKLSQQTAAYEKAKEATAALKSNLDTEKQALESIKTGLTETALQSQTKVDKKTAEIEVVKARVEKLNALKATIETAISAEQYGKIKDLIVGTFIRGDGEKDVTSTLDCRNNNVWWKLGQLTFFQHTESNFSKQNSTTDPIYPSLVRIDLNSPIDPYYTISCVNKETLSLIKACQDKWLAFENYLVDKGERVDLFLMKVNTSTADKIFKGGKSANGFEGSEADKGLQAFLNALKALLGSDGSKNTVLGMIKVLSEKKAALEQEKAPLEAAVPKDSIENIADYRVQRDKIVAIETQISQAEMAEAQALKAIESTQSQIADTKAAAAKANVVLTSDDEKPVTTGTPPVTEGQAE